MDEIHDSPHGSDIRLGEHAVAEIEDVARTSTGAGEDVMDLTGALRGGREQCRRVEIALDRAIPAPDAGPGSVQRNAPVDADHVAAGCCEIFEKGGGAGAEVNHRNGRRIRERTRFPAM